MLKFMGIGAQKCGTTWLYSQLRYHPSLHFPVRKEIHFWDLHYDRGIGWYRACFTHPSRIEGEITPGYAILPLTRIKEIHSNFPDLRLIYITRDPVARAWSAALMKMRNMKMDFATTPDSWFIDHFNSAPSRSRGNYQQCMDNWLQYYAQEQLLLLDFNDIIGAPRHLLERCAQHIGVSPDGFADDKTLRQRVHAGPQYPLKPNLRAVLEEIYRT